MNIHSRHIAHPFRTARTVCRRISLSVHNTLAERWFLKIRRGQRDCCWCKGRLISFDWHPSYGICASCGCYVNRRPPLPEDLKHLYSFDLYWHTRQKLKGYPTIEHRISNDHADGRIDYWLGLIERYGPSEKRVIEVGCAHGALLAELALRGFDCIGVEPDKQTAEWAGQNFNLDIRTGFFPEINLPQCNLFLAFDVIEHCPEPEEFMQRVAQLLLPSGIAIIQTPIDRYEYNPPFGERFESAFDDIEHLHLFTDTAMQELARRSGLEIVNLTERLWLHHEVCIFRKQE